MRCENCGFETKKGQRTTQQNRALHKYLSLVSDELQNQGQTMEDVINKISKVEIVPTPTLMKEVVWKNIQDVMLGKKSTTQLTKHEVREVYDIMSMWLSKNFSISIPFPKEDREVDDKGRFIIEG